MARDLTAIIAEIENRLEALDFGAAKAVFDFDAVPDSVIDKAYRIETRLVGNEYIMGNRAMTTDSIEIYIAYKLGRGASAARAKALNDREEIEKDIIDDGAIAALPQGPVLTLSEEGPALKYLENYLVSKVIFRCDYIRDLSSTT